MFTILYSVVSEDSLSNHSSTHDERVIGLFQTLKEAKEAARSMAQSILDRACKAALENVPGIIDSDLQPSMYEGEGGVSVYYLASRQEAYRYQGDTITHNFKIKEIENVIENMFEMS